MTLSAYERRLILSYLSNAFTRFQSGDAEAGPLLQWAQTHADQLEVPYPHAVDDNAKRPVRRKPRDEEVSALEWWQAGNALKNALAAAGKARPDRTARRLRHLAKATRLSRTDTEVLELLLRYQTGSLVESIIDDIGQRSAWRRRCSRLGNPVLLCLLGLSAGAVYSRSLLSHKNTNEGGPEELACVMMEQAKTPSTGRFRSMAYNHTVLGQILKLVPRHEFEREAREHHEGRRLRKMTRWGQFVAMVLGQLAGRSSLRDIVGNLDVQADKQYHLGVKARPDRTARRLRHLAKATRLSRTDTEVLERLLLRYQTGSLVESIIDDIGQRSAWRRRCSRLGSPSVSNPVLPCLLGLSAGAVYSRFAPDAPLMMSGLVSIDDDGDVTLIDRLKRLHWLPEEAGSDAQSLLLDGAKPSELRWSDFDHVAGDRNHLERLLKGALQTGQKGVNILIHGLPGTGKTEFCKTLAGRLGAPLYSVGEADANGGEPLRHERMQELRLTQRLLAGDRRSILLFDEMEDLLAGPGGMLAALFGSSRFRKRSAEGSKVFMNRLLEETPVPVLWTSNSARWTSPVLLRRMMFALELRQPPPKVRERIWARHLAHHGIKSTQEDARALAREFDVTPGVASGVTVAARLGGGTVADVRRGVQGLARVLSGDTPPTQPIPKRYDPSLICADVGPVELADRLVQGGARHFSVCLQGPPGTGKSAFVRHLADRLGLEVIQKRASDLMSMWVGGTEKAIAAAFTEARDAEAFLVFDEADSMLADRRLAQRSWEVSQVNEMLTWMESHPLPFACTTNFGERLDPATLRRFTFKIALDYLSPEQAMAAFSVYFGIEPPTEVAGLANLTPGDFSVVRRKAEVLGCLGEPGTLVEMLYQECKSKPGHGRKIGFNL